MDKYRITPSRFFIERPRFATVIAIIIVLAGVLAIRRLPVKEYPTLTPPRISVQAIYPGADAETLSKTVAAPLEEAINGVPGMIYMVSTASSSGMLGISVFFEVGTDPDVAKMNVNNRVQTVLSKLPEPVRRQGITVRERSPDLLKVYAFYSDNGKTDPVTIANYIQINVIDDIRRIPGVGDAIIFDDKRYSIRIWLLPDKLARFGLTPVDVYEAIRSQNEQFAAGTLGDVPLNKPQVFTYPVKGEGRLKYVKEFENIILRSRLDGSHLRLKDVARIELASESYGRRSFFNGKPTIPVGIFLAPGANALDVSDKVDSLLQELSKKFPPDLKYDIPYNPAEFVRESIREVLFTLGLAIILVVVVTYPFLGTWRATIIPSIAIPVSIIGTFAGMYAFGFSINLLTLFGLVLAIGFVVDDAIIVVENVERIIREEDLPVKEATIKAMGEITGPIIAIILVLSSVFIPASFVGGFSGKMYQQFAVTIAFSAFISGIVALTLTPALCAVFLRKEERLPFLPVRLFQRFFDLSRRGFVRGVRITIKLAMINLILFAIMLYSTYHLMNRLPTGLLPMEDKGFIIVFGYLMPGASLDRTEAVVHKTEQVFSTTPEITKWVAIAGLDLSTFSFRSDASTAFVHLADWDKRKRPDQTSMAIAGRLMGRFMQDRDALIFAVNPPPIMGMSITGGFELYIQDRTGGSIQKLNRYAMELVRRGNARPELRSVRSSLNVNFPAYTITVDREKARALGVAVKDIYAVLMMTFGKGYVNDFNLSGRTYHVNIQADGDFRRTTGDYNYVFVRSKKGDLIPVSSLIKIKRTVDASIIQRFNMFSGAKITGSPAPGFTSGDAMKAISEVAKEVLPPGYTIAWAGTSYQEAKLAGTVNVAPLYAVIFVFLILVALYESWSAPFAIMLSVPFAVFGAVTGLFLRGLESDIYLQIGLITLIGLAARNAILIVEFAEERFKRRKMPLLEATVEASRIRFRPIVMTAFTFIAGAFPLVIGTGAGANSRHIIGTTVVAGMLFATVVGIYFIPLFYYLIRRVWK